MKKENALYAIIGLLAGMVIGYIGTNYLNQTNAPAANRVTAAQNTGNMPADHPPAGGGSGEASGGQGDVMAVIQTARNEPNNFAAQMQAGGMFREIKRYEQALEFYQRAVKANPRDFEAHARLGDTYFDLQRYQEAEGPYRQALQIQPQNVTVRMDLGLTFFLRQPRNLDQAIAEFRQGLRVDARHEKTLQNLTAALIEKGDLAAARQTLQQLAAVNPDNPSLATFRSKLP